MVMRDSYGRFVKGINKLEEEIRKEEKQKVKEAFDKFLEVELYFDPENLQQARDQDMENWKKLVAAQNEFKKKLGLD